MSKSPPVDIVIRRASTRAWIALPMLFVLIAYLWFISAGMWTSWPSTAIYDYYSHLAAAFDHGHTYLDDKPSPELLALRDPYRKSARLNIPYIWDASLFGGRYYLYWGPTPAVIILPLEAAFSVSVGDNVLVFAFVAGLYLTLAALLVRTWHRFFQDLPPWLLVMGLLLAGLIIPLTWMLNRPEVYEAAIAAGQFFLFLGLYFSFAALDRGEVSIWRLCLASAFWGLAVGSRTSQAFPVIFLMAASVAWLYVDRSRLHVAGRWVGSLSALLLPVAISAAALAWYNWTRFGSVTEFGYRYQLTILPFPQHYDEIFSIAYVLPNLYNYLLNPVGRVATFPFIKPQYGRTDFGSQVTFPRIYFSEAVTGLLYTAPILLFALLPPLLATLRRTAAPGASEGQPPHATALRRLRLGLAGIAVLEAASLLGFFFATMRYFADVIPALMLLAVLGFWDSYRWFRAKTVSRALYAGVAIVLATATLVTSTLLAISSYQERFQTTNPALMDQLNRLFLH